MAQQPAAAFRQWECSTCGHVYDEAEGDELTRDLLPESVLGGPSRTPRRGSEPVSLDTLAGDLVLQGLVEAGDESDQLHSSIVNRVERELIAQVMSACNNVQIKAAARLGINRNTLHKKLKEYGLENGATS